MKNNKKIVPIVVSKKNKLPKYANGWYDADGITKAGSNAASTIGGVGSIVSGASQFLKTDDASSVGNYAGNILGNSGQFASMGAALGPWGAVGGAVLGAGLGIAESISADKAQQKQERLDQINENTSNTNLMSNQVNAKYNMRNQINRSVPGIKDGIPMFNNAYAGMPEIMSNKIKGKNMPRIAKGTPSYNSGSYNVGSTNAIIAPEEVTMDGMTGELNKVPGTYNASNPDTVKANLTPGTSVFTNQKNQIIPGGKSTPADIMSRATKVQKINDRVFNPKKGDIRPSRLDRQTAMLNDANIKNAADNINKMWMLNNANTINSSMPKYDGGIAFTANGRDYYNTDTKSGMYKSNPYYYKNDKGEEVYIPKQDALEIQNSIPQNFNTGFKNNVLGKVVLDAKGNPIGIKEREPYTQTEATQTQQPVQTPTVKPEFKNNSELTDKRYDEIKKTITNPTQTAPVEPILSTSTPSSASVNTNVPVENKSGLKPLKTPSLALKANKPSDAEIIRNLRNIKGGNPSDDSDNYTGPSLGSKLSSIGNNLAALAPQIYNAFNNTPEVTKPIYDSYMNVNQRYNVAPQLDELRKQRNIARYNNASMNTSTGANMAYGSDIYSKGVSDQANIYNQAEIANNKYRADYADTYNRHAATVGAENRRIQDINMRNRAAARNMNVRSAEMLSQYAQTQELMKNQKEADFLNSNIWGAYAGAIDPKMKKELQTIMNKYLKK